MWNIHQTFICMDHSTHRNINQTLTCMDHSLHRNIHTCGTFTTQEYSHIWTIHQTHTCIHQTGISVLIRIHQAGTFTHVEHSPDIILRHSETFTCIQQNIHILGTFTRHPHEQTIKHTEIFTRHSQTHTCIHQTEIFTHLKHSPDTYM